MSAPVSLTERLLATTQSRPARRLRLPRLDRRRPAGRVERLLLGGVAWVLFVLGWHLAATSGLAPEALFPGPVQVTEALWKLFAEHRFAADVWASIQRIFASFSLAVAIALPLGLLMGAFPRIDALLNPLLGSFRYLPAPAFIPLLLMWLGTGESQKLALLLIGVVFFLVIMIADVTRQVPKEFVETAKTLGGNERVIVWTVILRQSLPGYVDTCRQMLAVSWTYLVIAEIVAATDGIGAMMMRAKRFVHVDDIMAGILVIGILGLAFDAAFRFLHRFWFPYLQSNHG
jgi:NitT/TauT family transport system permease protein